MLRDGAVYSLELRLCGGKGGVLCYRTQIGKAFRKRAGCSQAWCLSAALTNELVAVDIGDRALAACSSEDLSFYRI